ncbi:MAG: (2Fe-2S) ferredoxin domain-containing protein [Clostridia bacterium]|nr:(2Fe-2S) ferredoxin domain-containing protein [Clostridia bacterium]
MVINVCVGSSCHLKGSYDVIQTLKKIIEDKNLGDKVELKASFCLGNCSNGVSMKVDNEPLDNVTPENIEQIFNEQLMPRI